MTPLPKRRWSSRRQGKKRASFVAASQSMIKCGNCGEQRPSHAACPACGFYKGKPVILVKSASQKS